MSTTLPPSLSRFPWARFVTATLVVAAVVYTSYQLSIALDPDDTGRLETTLVLSVSGQLDRGFASLYGPFSGSNPLVLIHAPLYYRLAALVAWALTVSGLDTLAASLVAGRLISAFGTLGMLLVAFRLGALDGGSRRAGLWAAALVAASPVLGILTVMVRPDTLAVLLQTAGLWLVARALLDERPRVSLLATAYAAFALAFCAKQHDVFVMVTSSAMLAWACLRRRAGLGPVVAAHAVAAAVAGTYLGFEDWLTDRRMSLSVFELPGGPFREINYATWSHVATIATITAKKSVGLLVLAVACLAGARRVLPATRLDGLLLIYLGVELAALVPLCLFNLGAADNYALQAVVLASILLARAADRALREVPARAWVPVGLGLAALVVLARDVQSIEIAARTRRQDRAALSALLDDPRVGRRSGGDYYFVGLPQHNRLLGRPELAHDEWLYGAFESVAAAEPRESWLRPALEGDPVRKVVVPDDQGRIPGLADDLPGLGYARVAQFGPYRVWERRR
jgi:hypothetical protein